ncbi:NADH-ubiquinone oxidoreductase assembly factor N7BML [Cytospora mali]|uniref:NADH-ubiquinone oxidoreductase assembly factor N7BML n=1 Tax=Cytospora mali TaxID=578113 RepID=A0A194VK76_CYTMA|nr:NADH-ubiquinone oxidoreductase assembly factor N7BML [Valsa mali]
MSSKQISPLLRSWYKWKALRLPWRKKFLIGLDLQGNTYWEFRDVRGDPSDPAVRWRRIVEYPRNTHFGDVKVPPQWHQWLRYIRVKPPSIQEQHAEIRRQQQIKYLAAEADARWEAKPRYVDAPGQVMGQPVAALESKAARGGSSTQETQSGEGSTQKDTIASGLEQEQGQQRVQKDSAKDDPWKQPRRGGPSEAWQPNAWTPPPASKR